MRSNWSNDKEDNGAIHDFKVDEVIHRQSEGGAIGMDLTGVVSDIYMCEWDRQLIMEIEAEQMSVGLYKRYKDDVNVILEVEDADVTGGQENVDQNTMDKVKRIAETIDPSLKVTTDCCSNHESGKLPVLDLQVWIGEDEEGNNKVLYKHYMKDVVSRSTIHYRSSHSMAMKRNVLTNEMMRIIRNNSDDNPWEDVTDQLSYFMLRMQFSGYPIQIRQEIAVEVMKKCHDKYRIGRWSEGERHPQRPRTTNKYQWYTMGGRYESVMFVQATPKSELRRRLGMKIRIIEKAGATIKSLLQRSNPFGIMKCGHDQCKMCNQDGDDDCRTRGCVYEYVCVDCQRRYRGQTGRSISERDKEHMEAWDKGNNECPFQRHSNLYHNGDRFTTRLNILAKCYGKPSKRMITEAVLIDEMTDEMTMNNKSEWSYMKLCKVHVPGQDN